MIPETLLQRLETCRNGDRPDALRGLGDYLAGLDAAGLAAVRPDLLKLPDLRAADLDGLRADALRRMEEERRAQAALDAADAGEVDSDASYSVQIGLAGTPYLVWHKRTPDGVTPVIMAHFAPRVTGETVRHKSNGETMRVLTVEIATPRGARVMDVLPEDLADSRRFLTCCYNALGGDLVLSSTTAAKHLPIAATVLADKERERSEVYEFTGWHDRDGAPVYLAAGGAIGTGDAVTVDLAGLAAGAGVPALAGFGPRDDGDEALAVALAAIGGPVRRAFTDSVTLPGLAAVWLAPLLRFSPTVDRPALHYIGTSGVRKSAQLALLQAFYGLPEPALSWRGTANSIEIALSALRDALVTVDDLKAGTSDRGAGVKIIQAYADRRGRSRATRTGELATARFVGGLLVSAGEDIPSGEASVAARALFVPVPANAANLEELTAAQAAAPNLPTATARYIAWLLVWRDDLAAVLSERFTAARAHYRQALARRSGINDAGRVAVNCALLDMGASVGADWLRSAGWTADQANEYLQATREVLRRLALLQAEAIGEESAALSFLAGLRALLDGRRVELVEVEAGKSLPALAGCAASTAGGLVIGWRQDDALLLQPDLALAEVRRWLSSQGRQLPTDKGLYAQLRDGGYLAETSGDKSTAVRWIAGRSQRVLTLKAGALSEPAGDAPEEPNF